MSHRKLRTERLEPRHLLAISVTTEQDVVDPNDGFMSLREAIETANRMTGPDEIVFDFGHDGRVTILLEEGELTITDTLTITGDGPDLLTIDAQEQSRIINITAETGDFTLAGMTLTNGRTIGDNKNSRDSTFHGGGIRHISSGSLSILNMVISGNATIGSRTRGGGVFAEAEVILTSSSVSNNASLSAGGGIHAGGNLAIEQSTISGNTTQGSGGGASSEGEVSLISSIITENLSESSGGGILSGAGATVISSEVSFNTAHGYGGGLQVEGSLTVVETTISGNTALNNGGGGLSAGDITVIASTISNNSATGFFYGLGGAIRQRGGNSMLIRNSTISGNSAFLCGGVLFAGEQLRISHATIAYNLQTGDLGSSGGICGGSGNSSISVDNSIVGANSPVDISFPITQNDDISFSLIGDNTGTDLAEAPGGFPDAKGNLIGGLVNGTIDPMLGPLAEKGGPTLARALQPGSPAINAGDPTAVAGVDGVPLYDQRGQGFDRVVRGRIDMGAFEFVPPQSDFDKDGDADGYDFLIWQAGFNRFSGDATPNDGDADGDGDVDGDDFMVWQADFGGESTGTERLGQVRVQIENMCVTWRVSDGNSPGQRVAN